VNGNVVVREDISFSASNGLRREFATLIRLPLDAAGGAMPLDVVLAVPFDDGKRIGDPASFVGPQLHQLPLRVPTMISRWRAGDLGDWRGMVRY
jgi:hypothetical protein